MGDTIHNVNKGYYLVLNRALVTHNINTLIINTKSFNITCCMILVCKFDLTMVHPTVKKRQRLLTQ